MFASVWLLLSSLFYSLQLHSGSFPKPLSAEEERHYLSLSAQGDLEARNILVVRNLRLVAHVMKKYYAQTADQEDLISIGTIGLMKGVTTFDPSKGARLATYAGIDRSTYIHYEEAGRDFYPKEHMEKLAELFEVPLEDLLDDYNLFLLRGQGAQIKALRQRLGLTQKAYATQLGVPLQKFKRWEQGSVQTFKSTWEKYFKQT